MKLLLSWIAKHITCNIKGLNVKEIVHLFNIRTAEIESFQEIYFQPEQYFVCKIEKIEDTVLTFCSELNQQIQLNVRTDAIVGKYYLITRKNNKFTWSSLADFSSNKDGLMPAVHVTNPNDHSWKTLIAPTDYILDIDNKSINHRPDLWGHYGVAREIAAFLEKKLISIDSLLAKTTIQHEPLQATNSDLTIILKNPEACWRVAAMKCNNVTIQDSDIVMAINLARCDIKPINAMVDITNFVMLDLGHPMHAFDASTFDKNILVVRSPENKEELQLLDGQIINLEPNDIIIANQNNPVSLAGIMGGKHSGINNQTTNVILEAAGFDPLVIRKTATRTKLRTESCMRFEKHLDPMQNVTAIKRFLKIAQTLQLIDDKPYEILSVGTIIEPITHLVTHSYFENQIGTALDRSFIEKTLQKIEFAVKHDAADTYQITIPTFRASKDIKAAHDIAEEIIRFYGFENLKTILPLRQTKPFDISTVRNISYIKRFFAYTMNMHELKEYLLYDESFIQKLNIDKTNAIIVKNPMSANWTTLATSLIPHLLKAIENNAANNNHLRFFENNAIWHKENNRFVEIKKFAGIIFDKKEIDFYTFQNYLSNLYSMLDMPVSFQKPTQSIHPWCHPYQISHIMHEGSVIGYAAMINQKWMQKITAGSAFIFELDDKIMTQAQIRMTPFKAWSKFQDVSYDISVIAPSSISADFIKSIIVSSDPHVVSVEIVDFFEKTEWDNKKAITLRYTMNNEQKTMTKEEIDLIVTNITQNIIKHGIQIR